MYWNFLALPMQHNESHLQKTLIHNMKHLILELGKDYILLVKNTDYRLAIRIFLLTYYSSIVV